MTLKDGSSLTGKLSGADIIYASSQNSKRLGFFKDGVAGQSALDDLIAQGYDPEDAFWIIASAVSLLQDDDVRDEE